MANLNVKDILVATLSFIGGGGGIVILKLYNDWDRRHREFKRERERDEEEAHDYEIETLRLEFQTIRLQDYADRVERVIRALVECVRQDDPDFARHPKLSAMLQHVEVELASRPQVRTEATGERTRHLTDYLKRLLDDHEDHERE